MPTLPFLLLALGSVPAPVHPIAGWRDSLWVDSDGARLFVDLRGADSTQAVLLILHGGPGEVENGLWSFMAYPGPILEQDFVVAYLYQRGLVRSGAVAVESQTVAQHVRDVDAVVSRLLTRFHRQKIYLVGHSWGGTLGWLYVAAHPSKVAGFAAVAGPSSVSANERAGYDFVLRWATRTENAAALADLKRVGPPPWPDFANLVAERRWAAAASGPGKFNLDADRMLAASGVDRRDSTWAETGTTVARAMWPQLMAVNVEPGFPRLAVPALVIVGSDDAIVPPTAIKRGYDLYRGPKRFSVFEGSAHFPFIDDPDRFAREILGFFRP